MTQEEYLGYLQKLVGDDSGEDWTEDNTFGLFQNFRPDGKGVELVFEPLPKQQAEELLKRILPLYTATYFPKCEQDAYFIPRQPLKREKSEEQELGKTFLTRLNEIAKLMKGASDELAPVQKIKRIEVVKELDEEPSDFHTGIHEVIGDSLIDCKDFNGLLNCLSEAYYSTTCDYWIAHYLSWPQYAKKYPVDLFEPVFELWKSDKQFRLEEDVLKIGPR